MTSLPTDSPTPLARAAAWLALAVLISVLPAAAAEPDPALERALTSFFRNAEVLHFDAVPDLYEGGYARISVYTRRARIADLLVEEGWVRLRGATLNVAQLREGNFRVDAVRDAAMRLRVSIRALEESMQAASPKDDIRITSDGTFLYGQGTVPLGGRLVRVELKGTLLVRGTPEVFLNLATLRLNNFPLPSPLVEAVERRYNPVVKQRRWPVRFNFHSIRLTREEFLVSSEADPLVCSFCADVPRR